MTLKRSAFSLALAAMLLSAPATALHRKAGKAGHKAKHTAHKAQPANPFKPGTFLPGAPPVIWLPDGRAVYVGANGRVVDMKNSSIQKSH